MRRRSAVFSGEFPLLRHSLFWRINVKRATGKAKNTEQKKNFLENVVGIKLAYIYKGVVKKLLLRKREHKILQTSERKHIKL